MKSTSRITTISLLFFLSFWLFQEPALADSPLVVTLTGPQNGLVSTSTNLELTAWARTFRSESRISGDFSVKFYRSATSSRADPVLIGNGSVVGTTTGSVRYDYKFDWNAVGAEGIYWIWAEAHDNLNDDNATSSATNNIQIFVGNFKLTYVFTVDGGGPLVGDVVFNPRRSSLNIKMMANRYVKFQNVFICPESASACDESSAVFKTASTVQFSDIFILQPNINLPDGRYVFKVVTVDEEGRIETDTSRKIITDTVLPIITPPPDETFTANGTPLSRPSLTFATAIDENGLAAGSIEVYPIDFYLGTTSVIWTVTDKAGNVASTTSTVTIVPPSILGISCAIENRGLVHCAGSLDDSTATVPILSLNGKNYTATLNSGVWRVSSATIGILPDGTYYPLVTATTSAGQAYSAKTDKPLVIFSGPPRITINSRKIVNAYKRSQEGAYIDAGATAIDYLGRALGVTTIEFHGPQNAFMTIPGTYEIIYKATDIDGQTATSSRTVIVHPAPSGPVIANGLFSFAGTTTRQVFIDDISKDYSLDVPLGVNNVQANFKILLTASSTRSLATLTNALRMTAATVGGLITLSVPAGTVMADSDLVWNGHFNVLQATSSDGISISPDSGFVAVNSVVTFEIGDNDVPIYLSRAARISISGRAKEYAGFYQGGVSRKITTICQADTQNYGDSLPENGECRLNVGNDLVIWTKHFSRFIIYSQTPVPTPIPDNGGGGGGGGGGGSSGGTTSGGGGGGGGGGSLGGGSRSTLAKADANGDGKVDILDFVALMANWGKTNTGNPADFNKDGRVDILDFVLLMATWTK